MVHGGKYDYSKVKYVNQRTKVVITCPIHGDFEQTPKNHMNGQGCPKCGAKYASEWRKNDYRHFVEESLKRFGDRYSFPNIKDEYVNSHSKVTIKCNKCSNTFTKIACDHITSPNGGCQHCYYSKSKPEEEIGEYVKSLLPNETIVFNDRNVVKGYELDIFIPSMSIAIEFNGLYWHSSAIKDKNYHLSKLEACNSNGIRLIQIFEDEYSHKKDIVLAKIRHLLMCDRNKPKVYGRKCIIGDISYAEASEFLERHHIQGTCKSSVYIGAYYKGSLVGVMTFTIRGNNKWELTRFATDSNFLCVGIASKMFNSFINNFDPSEIKSFADRRWTLNCDNNLYTQLGFELDKIERPDYSYIFNGSDIRYHKFGFRKAALNKKHGLTMDMTESEMAKIIGAHKVYNCGLFKYVWKKN